MKNQIRISGKLRGQIASWLRTWQERRYAVRASRELLALYRMISAKHPELDDKERYKLVVMARNNCDTQAACAVLKCAEESFAAWPVMREFTLCDVIHYLVVSEVIGRHDGEPWIHFNIKNVVNSCIPRDFCRIGKR